MNIFYKYENKINYKLFCKIIKFYKLKSKYCDKYYLIQQLTLFIEDYIKFPNEYFGEYKGIKYLILRINDNYHVNGYLGNNLDIDCELFGKICEENFYCGITGGQTEEYSYGFDTMHWNDFNIGLFFGQQSTYKSFDFVKNILFKTIDEITKTNEYKKKIKFKNYLYLKYYSK